MIFPSWWTRLAGRLHRNETSEISEADITTLKQLDTFFKMLIEHDHQFFVSGCMGEGRCSLSTIWVARLLHSQSVGAENLEERRNEIVAALAGVGSKKKFDDVFKHLHEAGTFEDSKSTAARVQSFFEGLCGYREPRNLKSLNEAIKMIATEVCETTELPLTVPNFNLPPQGSDINRNDSDKKSDVQTQADEGASNVQ